VPVKAKGSEVPRFRFASDGIFGRVQRFKGSVKQFLSYNLEPGISMGSGVRREKPKT
jgi:hypothetical protein